MRRSNLRTEEGSATIIALIVVSLVAICVTSLLWQQNFEIRKLSIFKENTQIAWLQRSLISVVRLVLRIDLLNDPNVDHLGEIWALPIENGRIRDFLKNQDLPEELKNIEFSGSIQDAQALFNIANLWDTNMSAPNQTGIQTYANLLQRLGLNRQLADQTANYALSNNLKPQYLDDLLNIPGYTLETIKRLSPFAMVLPEPTTVNMNTTSVEIFLALVPTFSQAHAESFIQLRTTSPLKSQEDINQLLRKIQPNQTTVGTSQMDVKSNYWLANTNMVIDRRNVSAQTLIKRFVARQADRNFTVVLWNKQKIIQIK